MEEGIFPWRNVKSDFILADDHLPVGAEVEMAALRIFGDDHVRGPYVPPAVMMPHLERREHRDIDSVARDNVLVNRGALFIDEPRRDFMLVKVARLLDHVKCGQIEGQPEGKGDPVQARSQDIREDPVAFRITLDVFEKQGGAALFLRPRRR